MTDGFALTLLNCLVLFLNLTSQGLNADYLLLMHTATRLRFCLGGRMVALVVQH